MSTPHVDDDVRPHTNPHALPSLSIVIPVFNGAGWIEQTAQRAAAAVKAAQWPQAEIVIVDDGSTDDSAAVVERIDVGLPIVLVRQENKGRFLARKAGLDAATGAAVLLLDVRVFLEHDALSNLAAQLDQHPERRVWNGHVTIATAANPFARFWQAVTFAAWRRYLANPRLVSFTTADFDYYPKGTGCFFAPRQRLLDAYDSFTSHFDDLRRVSDDTALIRNIAAEEPIYLGPEFACTYHARDTFRRFLTHASYRGVHFVDGFLRTDSRYFWFLIAFFLATPVGLALLVLKPLIALALVGAGLVVVAGALLALRTPPAAVLWFTVLLPAFALVYGFGIWRGLVMAVVTRVRRRGR